MLSSQCLNLMKFVEIIRYNIVAFKTKYGLNV